MEDEHGHIINGSDNLELKEEEQEEEEALSLCDFPLDDNSTSKCSSLDDKSSKKNLRSPLADATEFFEFFNDFSSSDMCPADDIIFCGKLVPFKDKEQSPPTDQHKKNLMKLEEEKSPIYRRRSDSLSKLQSSVTRSNSVSSSSRRFKMRNSRSMDYQRLHQSSSSLISPAPEIERNCSTRSVVQSEISVKKAMKPRWYLRLFGPVKVPTEMELNDMKNRQIRRNPSTTMFPTTDAGGNLAVNRSSGKVSWRILNALSCKDHTSVAVTTSFALPQAS